VSAYDRYPYLCSVTGPEKSMGIGADCPENWNCQGGEGPNRNFTHTECVDEENVLDLVYVSRVRLTLERKGRFS
jgi:hypothetical protein